MLHGVKVISLSESSTDTCVCVLQLFLPFILRYSEEVICEEPLLTVDRQMGLNIVHPEGKVLISMLFSSDSVKTNCLKAS